MTPANSNTASKTSSVSKDPADGRDGILKEIGAKWNKFSQQDLAALKSKDDLVTQVVAKYSMEKTQAQHAVDALMGGRSF